MFYSGDRRKLCKHRQFLVPATAGQQHDGCHECELVAGADRQDNTRRRRLAELRPFPADSRGIGCASIPRLRDGTGRSYSLWSTRLNRGGGIHPPGCRIAGCGRVHIPRGSRQVLDQLYMCILCRYPRPRFLERSTDDSGTDTCPAGGCSQVERADTLDNNVHVACTEFVQGTAVLGKSYAGTSDGPCCTGRSGRGLQDQAAVPHP